MESKGVYLSQIPQAGEITLLAAVVDKEIPQKRNGGSYLALRLADRSAELDAKVWDNPETVAQLFSTADVVKVRGTVECYNDKPQLIVSRIRRCEPHEYDVSDFYPASRRGPEEMFGELHAFAAMIRDDSLRQLIESIVNDAAVSDRLKTAPAAFKTHHAFRSGLLEHVVSLCSLAVALTAHYQRLNLGWLIAGAILHDLGKIDTLTSNGVRFDYTTRGRLIEHVTLGLPEAFALSILDLLDARMEQSFGPLIRRQMENSHPTRPLSNGNCSVDSPLWLMANSQMEVRRHECDIYGRDS
jgi:3'-5' exoribonuclease